MKRVYTGFRDFFLFIRKLSNGRYVVDSRDKAFVEYYIGDDQYTTYGEALRRIEQLRKLHKLDRFELAKAVNN